MAMGIVSDKDFELESNKLKTPRPSVAKTNPANIPKHNESMPVHEGTVMDIPRGRGKGNVEVPNSLRNLIGITSINESRSDSIELAKQFGVSNSSVSAYARGATSTASYDETPNKPVLNKVKLKIQSKAKSRLLLALNGITPEKIENTRARDLAGIAKDMSAIYKDMEPDSDNSKTGESKEPFVVYSPIVHNENRYEVIVVKE